MQQLAVARIFEYRPGLINLVGFPDSRVLRELSSSLGNEVLLNQYREERHGRKVPSLIPSFPVEYTRERQKFFKRLPESRINKSFFDAVFPRSREARGSVQDFSDFCSRVYTTVEQARKELRNFRHLPEARAVLRRLANFDGELEKTLKALNSIDEASAFAVDTGSGVIVPIDRMPDRSDDACYRTGEQRYRTEISLEKVRVRMKKEAIRIAEQGAADFKTRIIGFVRKELECPQGDNVRLNFERLAVPARLYYRYARLLEKRERRVEEADWEEEEERAEARYPQFAGHYDLQNLFPPSLRGGWSPHGFVPIDFRTTHRGKKFLIAGLHSGGKSFFLENIVLASILAQLGVSGLADSLVLPQYNRVFYYRNTDNSREGGGKCEKEMRDVIEIANKAEEGDLLVFDEFLDSAQPGVATWLLPELLGRLGKTKSTVFVSTHRNPNYGELEKKGWVVMTPDYEITDGRVVPARKLKRGRPNERINRRYIRERYQDVLE